MNCCEKHDPLGQQTQSRCDHGDETDVNPSQGAQSGGEFTTAGSDAFGSVSRNYAATGSVHLDALTEYHALAAKG